MSHKKIKLSFAMSFKNRTITLIQNGSDTSHVSIRGLSYFLFITNYAVNHRWIINTYILT